MREVFEQATLKLTLFILKWLIVSLEKLHLYKGRINLMEDLMRENHYCSYVVIRCIPILLILQSIFGNFTMNSEVDEESFKSALLQLCAILAAIICWEITYIICPTYRIASILYGGTIGIILRLFFRMISLPIWIVSSYIIISSHELLMFDIKELKEFLLGDQSTECDLFSSSGNKAAFVEQTNLNDNVSLNSCLSNDGSFNNDHKPKITYKIKKFDRELLSDCNTNNSTSNRKIPKQMEKEKRLSFEQEEDSTYNENFIVKNPKLIVIECDKLDENATSKSSVVDKATKAQTVFDDSDFLVADEDNQGFQNFRKYETSITNRQINKPYKTMSAEYMMKIWELSENRRSNTMNEELKLSPRQRFNKKKEE